MLSIPCHFREIRVVHVTMITHERFVAEDDSRQIKRVSEYDQKVPQ